MNTLAESYKKEAGKIINSPGVIDYFSYFRKTRHKQAAKFFEKAAAEYTACDSVGSAAECYFAAAYNFMLAETSDKSAQCYILAAKMYGPSEYNKKIEAYLHAFDVYNKLRRPDMCIKCYDIVAGIYGQTGKYKEAIMFYEQCVQIAGKFGYNPVNIQEKIAVIQAIHFGYYSIAITVYDSIIQKTMNDPIVYPFMMIAILLRILVNEDLDRADKYFEWCLGVKGFMNTEYHIFVKELMIIVKSGDLGNDKKQQILETYLNYTKKDIVFNNIIVSFLVSQIIDIIKI
jgi:tetratricopeptide (TPR) repeat protein